MKRSTAYLIGAALIALSMTACSATGPAYNPTPLPDNQSRIVVYRPAPSTNTGLAIITIDGLKCRLKPNGYVEAILPSGDYNITGHQGGDFVHSNIVTTTYGGSTSYVRVTSNHAAHLLGILAGPIVSNAQGQGSVLLSHGSQSEATTTRYSGECK